MCQVIVTAGLIVLVSSIRVALSGEAVRIAGQKVPEVVDTTGAGDAFLGALGAALAMGASLPSAAHAAVKVAAVTVQRKGTQSSYPSLHELPFWGQW